MAKQVYILGPHGPEHFDHGTLTLVGSDEHEKYVETELIKESIAEGLLFQSNLIAKHKSENFEFMNFLRSLPQMRDALNKNVGVFLEIR